MKDRLPGINTKTSIKKRSKSIFRFLNWSSFQGINRLFILSSENANDRKVHTGYYLPKVEMKDYNVMIDRKNFFWSAG